MPFRVPSQRLELELKFERKDRTALAYRVFQSTARFMHYLEKTTLCYVYFYDLPIRVIN